MSRRTARTGRGRGSGKGSKKKAAPTRAERTAQEYEAKRRRVQPLVNFVFPANLSPADKRKLTIYDTYLFADHRKGGQNGITNGVRARVRVKDPEKLAKLQAEYGQGELPGIKYVWIPSIIDPQTEKVVRPKVRHRKTKPNVISFPVDRYVKSRDAFVPGGYVETQYLDFDKMALLRDTDAEVERVCQLLAEYADTDLSRAQFRIRNGENEFKGTMGVDRMRAEVRGLMTDYGDWQKWLDGLSIDTAGNQHTLLEYRRTKSRELNRRKFIKSANIPYLRLLRALEKSKRGAMTEVLTRQTTGSLDEVSMVRKTLESMRGKKLVVGDDSLWMLTTHGRQYLNKYRDAMILFD
jgi:hypothetical protein